MQNYNPIAKKKIDTDVETNIDRWIYVWKISIDAKSESISIAFDVVYAVNQLVVGVIRTGEYQRYNSPQNDKFTQLRNAQVGSIITGIIENDLSMINSFESINSDLKQF